MTSDANKKWKIKNPDKRREQQRRYRQRHPDKIKESKRRYAERKLIKEFKQNPEIFKNLEGKMLSYFELLTRLQFREKLPQMCEICQSTEDLHIHHKRYVYPIQITDLQVLCRKHHIEVHQNVKKPVEKALFVYLKPSP